MEICQLYKIGFDNIENHNPKYEELLTTIQGNKKLSASGVMSDWISKNLQNVKMYKGYDGEIYPKFKTKIIQTYEGE